MKSSSALRILLIEDSKGDAFLIERALHHAMPESHNVERTSTVAEALKRLSECAYDVALLDRSLPDAVGYDSLHSIQNVAPQLPVVYLTAYHDEEMALKAIEQGAQDYLFKDKMHGDVIKRAIQFAIIRKHFENELVVQANFDNLTGLANRILFENRLDMVLARMKRHGGSLTVLFIDLNRFKQVNDTYGHAVGDRLLAEIGRRLRQCLRPYDTAARFGGDEFAMLIEDMSDPNQCATVSQKVLKLCEEPFTTSGTTISVGASIGIATCNSKHNMNREELMRRADAAMYEAKSSATSAYKLFSLPDTETVLQQDPRKTA